MTSLLKFEIKRSLKTIMLMICMMTLLGVLLLLIDADHEEIVITISILEIFLPFLMILIMSLAHIRQDVKLDTKNLYLAVPRDQKEIIRSKTSYAVVNYIIYFIMIMIFKNVNAFGKNTFYITVSIIALGMLIELSVLLFKIDRRK